METKVLPKNIYENLPEFFDDLFIGLEPRERDVAFLSSLGVLSAILPNVSFDYDVDTLYPNLFVMIVAPPGSGKGIMKLSFELVRGIDEKIQQYSKEQKHLCMSQKDNDSRNCPPLRYKVIPGNISSSKFNDLIKREKRGVLIFESEIDTLSSSLKQDWGNFSDLLRKAFHHERISLSRKTNDENIVVNEPKLSVVLSGTPGQVRSLVPSIENGLFSRFIYYSFESDQVWRSINVSVERRSLKSNFEQAGIKTYVLYETLTKKRDFKINFTPDQQKKLDLKFSEYSNILEDSSGYFFSVIVRHAIMLQRTAAILTVIRNKDSIVERNEITCSDADFDVALRIIDVLIDHAIVAHNSLKTSREEAAQLNTKQSGWLQSLPEEFSRRQAVQLANSFNVSDRTIDNWLEKFTAREILEKIELGLYRKK